MPSDSAIGPTGLGYEVLVPAGDKSSPQYGLEYEVIVSVPGAERSIQFFVSGMSRLPRPGEKLDFDGPENDNLTLLVIDVRHAFSARRASGVRVYAVLDHGHGDPENLAVAHRLLEPPELKRWTSHFPLPDAAPQRKHHRIPERHAICGRDVGVYWDPQLPTRRAVGHRRRCDAPARMSGLRCPTDGREQAYRPRE